VEVRAADAAGGHLEQQLARARLGLWEVRGPQRPAGGVEHHRAHFSGIRSRTVASEDYDAAAE
jgi:hypothetical protein